MESDSGIKDDDQSLMNGYHRDPVISAANECKIVSGNGSQEGVEHKNAESNYGLSSYDEKNISGVSKNGNRSHSEYNDVECYNSFTPNGENEENVNETENSGTTNFSINDADKSEDKISTALPDEEFNGYSGLIRKVSDEDKVRQIEESAKWKEESANHALSIGPSKTTTNDTVLKVAESNGYDWSKPNLNIHIGLTNHLADAEGKVPRLMRSWSGHAVENSDTREFHKSLESTKSLPAPVKEHRSLSFLHTRALIPTDSTCHHVTAEKSVTHTRENYSKYGAINGEDGCGESGRFIQESVASNPFAEQEEFSFRHASMRNKLTLLSIASVNFCTSAAFALMAPFFTQEAEKKGVDQSTIGLIFGVYELIIFLTAPFFGGMIVKIGAKFMFLSGIFVSGTCGILFGTLAMCPSGTIYIVMCFLTRSLEAVGSSAVLVASFAITAHEFPNNVATVFGGLEAFSGFGMMVGPPLGGALFQWGGFGLPFYTIGGLLIVCGFICIYLLPVQNQNAVPFEGSTLSLFLKPSAFVVTMSIVFGSMAIGFLDPTLADHLKEFELSPFLIGLIFFLAPAIYALTAPIWGWIGDNKGYTATMIVGGNILSAISFILLGPLPILNITLKLWLVIISLILMGLFLGCALIPTFKALIDSAKANGFSENFQTFGIVSGLFNSAFSFGAFLGPTTVGGFVVNSIGFPWAAGICGLCLVIIGILLGIQQSISRYMLTKSKLGSLNADKGSPDDFSPLLSSPLPPTDVIGSNTVYCHGDRNISNS